MVLFLVTEIIPILFSLRNDVLGSFIERRPSVDLEKGMQSGTSCHSQLDLQAYETVNPFEQIDRSKSNHSNPINKPSVGLCAYSTYIASCCCCCQSRGSSYSPIQRRLNHLGANNVSRRTF